MNNTQRKKVMVDADAYEISKKVSLGITSEVNLKMELDRDVREAAEIAKLKYLNNMIMVRGENGRTSLERLIGAAMAKQLQTSKTGN